MYFIIILQNFDIMPETGYSGKSLAEKLGLRPGLTIGLLDAPPDYLSLIGTNFASQVVESGRADLFHVFATNAKQLEKDFAGLLKINPLPSVIWISWYKKTSKAPTDVSEDLIRSIVLPYGWVDVKVCCVSEQWSGLKIVKRISKK